jgi:hypothetical protein
MVDLPMEKNKNNSHLLLELLVPLLSFGGAFFAVIFWVTDSPADFRISILGCVFASWVLAYLAWNRPKKDIVALTTPIYSFIFLAVPTDNFSAVVLELLYAASLSILLVRLKYRFGRSGAAESDRKQLAAPLLRYIEQTSGPFTAVSPETAHRAAVVFVRFSEGEYGQAAKSAAAGQAGAADGVPCLARAFAIVSEQATVLEQSLPRPEPYREFLPEDAGMLEKPVLPAQEDEHGFDTTLDNALLVLFSVAWTASEADRPHLLIAQSFALKLLTGK